MDLSLANLSISNFNYFDAVIGSVVLILGIKGFVNGFIKEGFGLAGLIGGVYFAARFSDKAAAFLAQNFTELNNPALVKLVGFLAVLIIIWVGMTLLGQLVHTLTAASGLGFINRILGLVVGAGKYFVIFALIVTALSNVKFIKEKLEKHVQDSQLYPYLRVTGAYLINLDPHTFDLQKIPESIKHAVDSNITLKSDTNSTTAIH